MLLLFVIAKKNQHNIWKEKKNNRKSTASPQQQKATRPLSDCSVPPRNADSCLSWELLVSHEELLQVPMILMMVLQVKKHWTYKIWDIYPNFQVLLGAILTFSMCLLTTVESHPKCAVVLKICVVFFLVWKCYCALELLWILVGCFCLNVCRIIKLEVHRLLLLTECWGT